MSKVILTNDDFEREENFVSFEKINHKKPVGKSGYSQSKKTQVRNSRSRKLESRYAV